MGNQIMREDDDNGMSNTEYNVNEQQTSDPAGIDHHSHQSSRPRHVPKSRIRLVPLSGSPNTSAQNSHQSFSSLTNSNSRNMQFVSDS